jgi:AAA+ ATPase superfamily predicted ATPase
VKFAVLCKGEIEMKEKEIMKQFINRTVEMAKRDHDEILKMVNELR